MLSAEHVFAGGWGPDGGPNNNNNNRQGGSTHNGLAGGGGPGGSDAAAKLAALSRQCQGDHLLLLALYQLWAGAGFSKEFVRSYGLDLRGMNFAREVRKQLAGEPLGAGVCSGGRWLLGWAEVL
jgi:ATP-dependent RNA helicase DHX8/PRP22